MAAFVNTGSDLDSVFLVSAFVEACRKLNQAENARNAANTAVTPRQNIQMSANFDGNAYTIAASLPFTISLVSGKPQINATDYLGAPYSDFVKGTSEVSSTTLPALVLELSQKVNALELSVPEADRPNNLTIEYSSDAGVATIAATIPFTPTIGTAGEVTLTAIEYV